MWHMPPKQFLTTTLETNQLYAIYHMFLKLTKGAVSTATKSEQNSVKNHVEKFIIKISGTRNLRRKKYIKNYLKCWKAVFQQSNCWINVTYTLNGCKITWFVMFSSSNDRSFYNCYRYCLAHKIKHLYVERKSLQLFFLLDSVGIFKRPFLVKCFKRTYSERICQIQIMILWLFCFAFLRLWGNCTYMNCGRLLVGFLSD